MEKPLNREVETVEHNVGVTVWLDKYSVRELDKISLFEKEKRAPLCRRIILEKIQVYLRNPTYLRWLKQLNLTPLKEAKKKR